MAVNAPTPRPPPANEEQKEYLLAFMEKNVLFSQGVFRCAMGREDYRNEWDKLKVSLNAIPGGADKTSTKWQTYWCDQRDAVKKRAQVVEQHCNRETGGGPPTELLTDYQRRVLTWMGGWKWVIGLGGKGPNGDLCRGYETIKKRFHERAACNYFNYTPSSDGGEPQQN